MDAQAYIRNSIRERGWTIPQFAKRAHVSIGLAYKWLSEDPAYRIVPSPTSCAKIAAAFGLDPDVMLELAGHRQPRAPRTEPDEVEAAIRARTAEMREAVRDIPREFWPAVVKATFDTAIDGARNMAQLLADVAVPPVSAPGEPRVSASKAAPTGDLDEPKGPLTKRQPLLQRFLTPSLA